MLDRQVAESFVDLLSNQTDSLSSVYSKFRSNFDTRNRMILLTGISMLLSDGLLEHPHQIVASYLLFKEFSNVPIHDNPFLPVFLHILNDVRVTAPNFCPPQLYDIVSCFLDNNDVDSIGNMNMKTVLSPNFTLPNKNNINLTIPEQYNIRISPVLAERSQSQQKKPENANHQQESPNSSKDQKKNVMTPTQIIVELLCDPTIYCDFEVPYIRPAPEITPTFPGEVQNTYIASFDTSPALFDDYVPLNSQEATISLMEKAIDTKLNQGEIESLSREIKKNPELASEGNLNCQQIESLIENNTSIALDVVAHLVKKNDGLLEQLAKTSITPAKARVYKEILANPDLQNEQLNNYVNEAMNYIKGISDHDVFVKNLSLFCKMLHEIWSEEIKISSDLVTELYQFCVEYEQIPEANDLATLISESL